MISRSFFRQSAAFLGLSLCILTDSSPGMACTCPVPSTSDAPARPRRARGEEERERHGQTDTARPAPQETPGGDQHPPRLHLHHLPGEGRPAARMICTTGQPSAQHHDGHGQPPGAAPASCQRSTNPSDTPSACTCTGWEKERRGREARREEQGKTARRRAVKVIYTEPMPTSTCPAPENSQPLPVLLPAQLLCPLSCNSAFGEFAEPRPPEAPIADGEHLPARLLSI